MKKCLIFEDDEYPLDFMSDDNIKPKKKIGRKLNPDVQHNPENSSRKGLQQEWTRATFIIRDDVLDALKSKAYEKRIPIKALLHEVLIDYLKREGFDPETVKEMKEREKEVKQMYKELHI